MYGTSRKDGLRLSSGDIRFVGMNNSHLAAPTPALGRNGQEEGRTPFTIDLEDGNNSNDITRHSRRSRTHGVMEFKTGFAFTSLFPFHILHQQARFLAGSAFSLSWW